MFSKITFGTYQPWMIKYYHSEYYHEFYNLYPEIQKLEDLQYIIN